MSSQRYVLVPTLPIPLPWTLKTMPTIQRIRLTITNRHYYLSSHAEEEMREDHVERRDIEYAILNGKVEQRLTHDIRGTRYRIEGPTQDGRIIHVICRFHEDRHLIIITAYAREWEAI